MSEKPKPQMFYVQDPFTEEVQGPLSASDLKQRFSGGGLDEWGVSKSTTGPWTPASQVKGLRRPTAPSPESDTTAKSTVTSNTSLSGGGSVDKSTATATNDSSAAFFGFFAWMTGGVWGGFRGWMMIGIGCSLMAIGIVAVFFNVTARVNDPRYYANVWLVVGFLTATVGKCFLLIRSKFSKPKAVVLQLPVTRVRLTIQEKIVLVVALIIVVFLVGLFSELAAPPPHRPMQTERERIEAENKIFFKEVYELLQKRK